MIAGKEHLRPFRSFEVPDFRFNGRGVMQPPSVFSGGCACGAVRYKCSAAPIAMINCHCGDCQKARGGGYSPTVIVPASAFQIVSGKPNTYESEAESGNTARRRFCSNCGSPLCAQSSGAPEYVGILAGSLDDASWFLPVADMWVKSAQPWVPMSLATAKFDTSPPPPENSDPVR
jgi:hypothetical protein